MDFLDVAHRLLALSRDGARALDGNHSSIVLAGIPTLFAVLRCFAIELNSGFLANQLPDQSALDALANSASDASVLRDLYRFPDLLSDELDMLWQIRCELVHPAHRPGPETDGTPAYLMELKRRGLMQSTGSERDSVWIDQLKSHRLFMWGFDTIEQAAAVMIAAHEIIPQFRPHLHDAFGRHRSDGAI